MRGKGGQVETRLSGHHTTQKKKTVIHSFAVPERATAAAAAAETHEKPQAGRGKTTRNHKTHLAARSFALLPLEIVSYLYIRSVLVVANRFGFYLFVSEHRSRLSIAPKK